MAGKQGAAGPGSELIVPDKCMPTPLPPAAPDPNLWCTACVVSASAALDFENWWPLGLPFLSGCRMPIVSVALQLQLGFARPPPTLLPLACPPRRVAFG